MDKSEYWMTIALMEGALGERAMQLLNSYRPNLAYAVKGGKNDPSRVVSKDDLQWQRFTQFVDRNWT